MDLEYASHYSEFGMAYQLIFTDIRYLYSADVHLCPVVSEHSAGQSWYPVSNIYIDWMSSDTDIRYLKNSWYIGLPKCHPYQEWMWRPANFDDLVSLL